MHLRFRKPLAVLVKERNLAESGEPGAVLADLPTQQAIAGTTTVTEMFASVKSLRGYRETLER